MDQSNYKSDSKDYKIITTEGVVTIGTNEVIKTRILKPYIHEDLRETIRSKELRNEQRIVLKVMNHITTPKLIRGTDKELVFEKIEGVIPTVSTLNKYKDQLVTILCKIHQLGVVHNDLNLDNFLVTGDTLYILDFGMAYKTKKNFHHCVELYDLLQLGIDEEIVDKYKDHIGYDPYPILKKLKNLRRYCK